MKTYTCRKCHEKAVTYDDTIFNWICSACGTIEKGRNRDGSKTPPQGPRFIGLKERILDALRIPGTPTQLASRLGRRRVSISNALAELREQGLVIREGWMVGSTYHRVE